MSSAVFDKATELRNVADGAETATASETGVALPVRFLPHCDWVVYVTAGAATGTNETYVFSLEVSDLVGGTYTEIARLNWPRGRGVGKVNVPISGVLAQNADSDSAFVRVTLTISGSAPTITYGSYLTKASTRVGLGRRAGDVITFA